MDKEGILNVGIVGCGRFVQGKHLPHTVANPKLRLHALCDVDRGILDSLTGEYNSCYMTTDYRDIADDPEIDMAILGTGPKFRVEPIRVLAEAGKHIYVEKPMSMGYEDSAEIVDIIRRTGIKLQVGFNRSYSPIMREVKRIFHKMKQDKALICYRIVGESRLWPKFHQEQVLAGESTMIHELTHVFDLLNWITDSRPVSIYAIGGRSDDNIVTLAYPDRTAATIISGGCGTAGYPKERMEIFSGFSALVMDNFVELQCTSIDGEQDKNFDLAFSPEGNNRISVAKLRQLQSKWRAEVTREEIERAMYYRSFPSVDKGHYGALEHFRRCIAHDLPVETDEKSGALSTIMGLNALQSLNSGLPVTMADMFED